jgi:hypothetical protein
LSTLTPRKSTLTQPITTATPIEKALDELRVRLPKDIVIGFEELFDPRPDRESEVDLGPASLSLDQILNQAPSLDPKYNVELWWAYATSASAKDASSGKKRKPFWSGSWRNKHLLRWSGNR